MESSRLTQDVITYRGIRDARSMFADRLDGDLTGMVWTENQYTSTSVSEVAARNFASVADAAPLRMRILVPSGIAGIDLSPAGDKEQELLLQRGLQFRVVADHGLTGKVRRVDVEVFAVEEP